MAWYFIFLNVLFVALVVGAIAGGHLWAIATQHRDYPVGQPGGVASAAKSQPVRVPQLLPELLPA